MVLGPWKEIAVLTVEGSLLHAADRVAGRLGLFEAPLVAEELIALARRRSGLSDFGPEPFEEALAVLLESYYREAALSLFGRFAARWDVLRFLTNLLELREAEIKDPLCSISRSSARSSSAACPAAAPPSCIICWPRIPTILRPHALLGDVIPSPSPARGATAATGGGEGRPADRGLSRLAPERSQVHLITAIRPRNAPEITAHVFQSLRLDDASRAFTAAGSIARAIGRPIDPQRFPPASAAPEGPGRWILECLTISSPWRRSARSIPMRDSSFSIVTRPWSWPRWRG
jgi:hypothetical protein